VSLHAWKLVVPENWGQNDENHNAICPSWHCKTCGAVVKAKDASILWAMRKGIQSKDGERANIFEDCDEETVRQSMES